MKDQIPGDVKSQRVHRLTELESELRQDYFKSLVGSEVQVLVESSKTLVQLGDPEMSGDTLVRGTSCRYAPAEWTAESAVAAQPGDLVRAKVVAGDSEKILVNPV